MLADPAVQLRPNRDPILRKRSFYHNYVDYVDMRINSSHTHKWRHHQSVSSQGISRNAAGSCCVCRT